MKSAAKITSVFCVALLGAVLVLSCQPPLGGGGDGKGTLSISIPTVPTCLAQAMGATGTSARSAGAGRALLFASRVSVDLMLGEQVVDHWVTDLSWSMGPNPPQVQREVFAGSGYTVKADVYNLEVSDTEPVVSGTSATFNVTSGGRTDVLIRCIPHLLDATLSPDTPITRTLKSGVITGGGITGLGKELWFKIPQTAEGAIQVTVTPDPSSAVFFSVCDSTGKTVTMGISGQLDPPTLVPGQVASSAFLSPDAFYYVGVFTLAQNASVTSTITMSYSATSDDAYAPNYTKADAVPIAKGQLVNGRDFVRPPQGFGDVGGDWYTFTLGAGDDLNVTIRLVYQPDGAMRFYLYDATSPDPLLDSSNAPYTDAAKQMSITLTPGQYYIQVRVDDAPVSTGTAYVLSWTAGQGLLSINLE